MKAKELYNATNCHNKRTISKEDMYHRQLKLPNQHQLQQIQFFLQKFVNSSYSWDLKKEVISWSAQAKMTERKLYISFTPISFLVSTNKT